MLVKTEREGEGLKIKTQNIATKRLIEIKGSQDRGFWSSE